MKVPTRTVLGVIAQQVDLMVAQHGHSPARLNEALHPVKHRGTVRSPVAQVAHKHQRSPLRMMTRSVITQMGQQGTQGLMLSMNIPHDVQRTFGKRLNQTHHAIHHFVPVLIECPRPLPEPEIMAQTPTGAIVHRPQAVSEVVPIWQQLREDPEGHTEPWSVSSCAPEGLDHHPPRRQAA